jgi:hypothetical protein
VLQLLFTANVVPSSPILVTLKMEAINSSETSLRTRATLHKSGLRLVVTAMFVPSSPILVILMMKAIRSSETSVLTTATQR